MSNHEKTPFSAKEGNNLVKLEDRSKEENAEYQLITTEDLQKLCRPLEEEEVQGFTRLLDDIEENEQLVEITSHLLHRDINHELPFEDEELTNGFLYKRNIQLINDLRNDLRKTLRENNNRVPPEEVREVVSRLGALEKRKADWLEENYFPGLYEKSVNVAKAEVRQTLIKHSNLRGLDDWKDLDRVEVVFRDKLNALLSGTKEKVVGSYFNNTVFINIPEHYSEDDSWTVFRVAVHEFLHAVSDHFDRSGLSLHRDGKDTEVLNEAITEIITYGVAKDHLIKSKSPLRGERGKKLSLRESAYNEYTFIVQRVFSEIPLELFVDAYLNESKLDTLENKFDEVFGGTDQFLKYAEKLRNIYRPIKER